MEIAQRGHKIRRAEYIDKEAVVDGNLVTSRQPSDIPAFILADARKCWKTGKPRQPDGPDA